MQLILIFAAVTLMALAETRSLHISFPKLNGVVTRYHTEFQQDPIIRLPEERRQLAFFPRIKKKFVITTERQYVLPRPIKKRLMKKLKIGHRYTDYLVGKQPVINDKSVNEKYSDTPPVLDHPVKGKKTDAKITTKIFKNSEATKHTNKEILVPVDATIAENIKAEELILKPNEANAGSLSGNKLLQASKTKPNDEDNQIADLTEFIFLKPLKHVKKEPEVDIATDVAITTDPVMPRVKRSDNVIVEENLGTTVAGYKFTWSDTRLTNNLAFKNINS